MHNKKEYICVILSVDNNSSGNPKTLITTSSHLCSAVLQVFCTESRAKRVVVAVFILCFTLTSTTPHEWVIQEVTDEETGQLSLKMDYSDLGSNATYKQVKLVDISSSSI